MSTLFARRYSRPSGSSVPNAKRVILPRGMESAGARPTKVHSRKECVINLEGCKITPIAMLQLIEERDRARLAGRFNDLVHGFTAPRLNGMDGNFKSRGGLLIKGALPEGVLRERFSSLLNVGFVQHFVVLSFGLKWSITCARRDCLPTGVAKA